ncbi:branched-chain amino acid ABC transporter permease [Ramlibacter sp. WS9]|uniref:branched-chain amino acid ABC transporter permease n=1 Tax=Ramlibacter sp. WS9 TaxID=1882741 RepID=UPI0011421190|nr:branched-chain amino acid ABC transporter permease [Ramlibacter sp. WS9]ROZ68752.1 branched-chain amino acid ABC transporter permease [Ramlibacter sp. WS9]
MSSPLSSLSTVPVVAATRDAGIKPRLIVRSASNAWWVLALLAAALALTFVAKGYQLFQATMVLAYFIALLGLNLLTGYNGQISLGHGAFFAIGAYCAAILILQAHWPYWAVLPAVAGVCGVVGYLFGRPALKLEGHYLALATFALGVSLPQLLKYKHLERWTGGVQGLTVQKPEVPLGLPLTPDQWLYLFALFVAIVLFVMARNLVRSGSGRAMVAIRDHAMAAEAMGVDIKHYKAMTFGISAAYTGVGGAMAALAVEYVSPDAFDMYLSIALLVGMVVGGVGTLWGALFGAVFIMFVPALSENISKSAPWAVYGVVLIGFMVLMPGGVAGLINKLKARWSIHQERRRQV